MFEQNIILFSVFIVAGFLIIMLGFKFSDKTRKVIETLGAVTFHVGVFGILYYRVPLSLFISLFTLVIALFILLDPLKIGQYINDKIYKLFGYLILCAAGAFGIQFLTGFPVWPWIIPVVLYLSPYLISPLQKINTLVGLTSWALVFLYALIVGLVLYGSVNSSFDASFITKHFAQQGYLSHKTIFQKKNPAMEKAIQDLDFDSLKNQPAPKPAPEKTPPTTAKKRKSIKQQALTNEQENSKPVENPNPPTSENTPTITPEAKKETSQITAVEAHITSEIAATSVDKGPYLQSLEKADGEYLKIKEDHTTLKKKYNDLLKKNIELEKEIEELKELIRE